MEKNTKRFAVGAAIAAGVGYLTGILTAPKSGKETREDVKNAAVKAKREAEKTLKELHSDLDTQIARAKTVARNLQETGKKDLDKALEAANSAKLRVKNLLTSIHEGDVEDKDLKSAITEVTDAVSHLKKFLDKHV